MADVIHTDGDSSSSSMLAVVLIVILVVALLIGGWWFFVRGPVDTTPDTTIIEQPDVNVEQPDTNINIDEATSTP